MDDLHHIEENMLKLKDNLVKTRGEGIELRRKYDAILSEKEILLNEYQIMET